MPSAVSGVALQRGSEVGRFVGLVFIMSTSVNQHSVNPFASPTVAAPAPSKDKPCRLTEKSLAEISRCCCVADCAFLLTVICFQVAYGGWFIDSYMVLQYVLVAYIICSFLLWFAMVALTFRTKIAADIFMAFLLLPFPVLGALVFLTIRLGLGETMIKNGFRPRLFGFSQDHDQRKAMKADPAYRPSVKFERDGSKRKIVFSLCDVAFALGAICPVVPVVLQTLSR